MESATQKGLLPATVEKDYVIGWLLMGFARHPLLSEWVFKGGTCLKKCFFETYRFSEDLDFTVTTGGPYEAGAYRDALSECTDSITEETGIEFPLNGIEMKESHDKQNRLTFQGKVSYIGPLQFRQKTLPKVKIDLTQHELVVESPRPQPIQHPYSDRPEPPISILCYSVNEILAEKTRAIYERQGRARDVFDVVNIGRNYRESVDSTKARVVLEKKFQFKQLPSPSVSSILERIDEEILAANWDHQLRHQLPVLPPVDSYIHELKESSLWWIEPGPTVQKLSPIPGRANESSIPKKPFPQPVPSLLHRTPSAVAASGTFELIRYAARNRLCAAITYHGLERLAEPYSLRMPGTGNLLLYVHERLRGSQHTGITKAYKVSEIAGVRVTEKPFQARYLVEL